MVVACGFRVVEGAGLLWAFSQAGHVNVERDRGKEGGKQRYGVPSTYERPLHPPGSGRASYPFVISTSTPIGCILSLKVSITFHRQMAPASRNWDACSLAA